MEAQNENQYYASEDDDLKDIETKFIVDFFESQQAIDENENKYDPNHNEYEQAISENGNYHDMDTPNGSRNVTSDSPEFKQPYGKRQFQDIESPNDMPNQPIYGKREYQGIESPNQDECEDQINSGSEETIDQDEYWINDIIVYSPPSPLSDTNDEHFLNNEHTPQNININNNSPSNTFYGHHQVDCNENINIDTSNSEFSNLNITLCNVPQTMRNLKVRIHPVDINNAWLSSIYRKYENDLWEKTQRDLTSRNKRWIWKCLLCNKSLMKFESLKYHLNVHLGLYPFACKMCGKCYTSRTQAVAHLRFLHQVYYKYEYYLGN